MVKPGRRHVVIAIDGPAASGKSSTALWVAERLGYRHVDSGSLYRAATAAQLRCRRASTAWTEQDVLRAAESVSLEAGATSFVPLIAGKPADDEIRGPEVTRHVSQVAQMPSVRAWVNAQVKSAADAYDVVVDGRDMGTVVFPDADLKVFLVADPWERARRRLMQLLQRGPTPQLQHWRPEPQQVPRCEDRAILSAQGAASFIAV